jgi:hypothetical protein
VQLLSLIVEFEFCGRIMKHSRSWQAVLPLLFITGFAGAVGDDQQSAGTTSQEPDLTQQEWEELALRKADERWQLLIEGRKESAYEYLSPGYRQTVPYTVYQRSVRGVGLWKSAKAKSATCDPGRCVVTTELHIEMRNPRFSGPIPTVVHIEEGWLIDRENRQLWFVPNK